MNSPARPDRGPHPLSLFLSMAMRVTANDPVRMARLLDGLNRYQNAPLPPAMPAMPIILQRGGTALREVAPASAGARTIVVVPSLINAPRVLDLAPDRSFVRHLAAQGHHVLMVDWGDCTRGERRLGLAGMVSARLVPLLRQLPGRVDIIGYCLGGTLALAAAARVGQQCRSLALIAAPWHFDGFPPSARLHAAEVWSAIRPMGRMLGAIPISLLNPLFWSLDEQAVIAKFERLASCAADDPQVAWFASVEDWANSGAPLSPATARDLFSYGFARDRIGQGKWRVGGVPLRPESLACPLFDAGASADRIVPPAARIRRPGVERITVAAGHVGMVVGTHARAQLWEPLSNWLQAQ